MDEDALQPIAIVEQEAPGTAPIDDESRRMSRDAGDAALAATLIRTHHHRGACTNRAHILLRIDRLRRLRFGFSGRQHDEAWIPIRRTLADAGAAEPDAARIDAERRARHEVNGVR